MSNNLDSKPQVLDSHSFSKHARKSGRRGLSNVEDMFQEFEEFVSAKKLVLDLQEQVSTSDNSDWNSDNDLKDQITEAENKLESVKFDCLFGVLESQKHREQPLQLKALQYITDLLERNKHVPITPKRIQLLANEAFLIKDDESFKLALRSLVMAVVTSRETYQEFITSQVFVKLRKVIKDVESHTPACLVSAINALTSLHLFLWFDCEAWEPEIQNDISLLLALLEQFDNDQVNVAATAAIGLLVYYSKDWNETFETVLFQLFELYQVKTLSSQVAFGKAIALMYNLYDFSDQKDAANRTFRYTILTVDNGQLMHELSNTAANLKKQDAEVAIQASFKNVQQSISTSLGPLDQNYAEQQQLMTSEKLHIGENKGYSWLQDLLYSNWIWLYGSSLAVHIRQSDTVCNAFYSTCTAALNAAKTNVQKKNLTRSHHMTDIKSRNYAREQLHNDAWSGHILSDMYREVGGDNVETEIEEKRADKVKTKDLRRQRLDKLSF